MQSCTDVNSRPKLIHYMVATSADAHKFGVTGELQHMEEIRVWGDSAYTDKEAIIREHVTKDCDFTHQRGMTHVGAAGCQPNQFLMIL